MAPSVSALRVFETVERVIEVTGSDRSTYLEATTTQALATVGPGTSTQALVLDPNGAPVAVFDVLLEEHRVLLVVPDPTVESTVLEVLGGRTFLSDARFRALPSTVLRVLPASGSDPSGPAPGVMDPSAATPDSDDTTSQVRAVLVAAGLLPAGHDGSDALVVAAGPAGAALVVAVSEQVSAIRSALAEAGIEDASDATFETWRVQAGLPAWGHEFGPGAPGPHLPEELGLLTSHVHLAKGCYPGQEAVARMWMLGRPRRRLAVVTIDGAITVGWRTGVGRDEVIVTSLSPSTPLALAFVPGPSMVGSRFTAEDGSGVEVVALPGATALPPGHDPAMRRRRDRDQGSAVPPSRLP